MSSGGGPGGCTKVSQREADSLIGDFPWLETARDPTQEKFLRGRPGLFEVGDRIEVEFDGGSWYGGIVTGYTVSKRLPRKYSVSFDDGDQSDDVDPLEMRRLHSLPIPPPPHFHPLLTHFHFLLPHSHSYFQDGDKGAPRLQGTSRQGAGEGASLEGCSKATNRRRARWAEAL